MTVETVVLAGGRNSAAMEEATGVVNRALVPLAGKTMLEWIVDALRGAPTIGRIFVVGDVPEGAGYTCVPPPAADATLMDNLIAGLAAAGANPAGTERVLVTTSDIPFVTAPGIEDFVVRALADGAELCYPIVSMDLYRQRFPTIARTTLRTREGLWTAGNMMLIDPQVILPQHETVLAAYAARKSSLRLGRLLGWGLLVRIIAAQTLAPSCLTLASLEAGVGRILGPCCRASAIQTPYPEIGTDVDKPGDIAAAQTILARPGV